MDTLVVAVRVALSLAVVLGLMWFMHRRLTRGVRVKGSSNPINIAGRQSVGQKATVVVVDVDGRRFLLGVTEQSINVLHSGDAPAEVIPAHEFARSLGEMLDSEPGIRTPDGTSPTGPRTELSPVSTSSPRREALARSAASGTGSMMGGSILSVGTWKQTAAALRRAR